MTGERDIERTLNTWFSEGPSRMPDGFLDRMVGRIETVPQSRLARVRARVIALKPTVRLAPRPNVRLAVVVAIVVIVAIAGGTILSRLPTVGVLPSPSPSTSPSPSARSDLAPPALYGMWVPVGQAENSSSLGASSIDFRSDFEMHVDSQRFYSSPTYTQSDRFQLVLRSASDLLGCNAGDSGLYTFSVSPGGVLTLSGLTDACTSRAGILAGTWVRWAGVDLTPADPTLPESVLDMKPLEGKWLSVGTRIVPRTEIPQPLQLIVGPTSATLLEFWTDIENTPTVTATDELTLRLGAGSDAGKWDCTLGDVGSYTVSLTALGTALMLTPISDACSTRAGVLAGEWARSDCPDTNAWCLGDLQPGRHTAIGFRVTDFTIASLSNAPQLTYSVPDSWSNTEDDWIYTLVSRDYSPGSAIRLYSNVAGLAKGNGCSTVPDSGAPWTASRIADWLATVPGLATTTSTPITIGGLSGLSVDISIAPGWKGSCVKDGRPVVNTVTQAVNPPAFQATVSGNGHARYILLDVNAGTSVREPLLIEIAAPDKASWDALVVDATPIVQSFEFTY